MFMLVIFVLENGDNEEFVVAVLNPGRAAHAVAYQNGVVLRESTNVVWLNSQLTGVSVLIPQLRPKRPTFFGRGLALEVGMHYHTACNPLTYAVAQAYA